MKKRFTSLDRHVTAECAVVEPDRYRQLSSAFSGEIFIPRGAGLSYAPASFAPGSMSIDFSRFDRILDFNPEDCWIDVEAGISLGKLFEFLTPKGLQLPVLPGHPQITVGGCIAGNVHGKSQFTEGVFGATVLAMDIVHPDHGTIRASPTENADVFDLTIGGLGLTGLITRARLSVTALPGNAVLTATLPFTGLLTGFKELANVRERYDMAYSWIDLTGADDGRAPGFVITGNFIASTPSDIGNPIKRYKRLDPSQAKRRPRVFSDGTLGLVNRVYRHLTERADRRATAGLFGFMFPAVGKEFYFDFFGDLGFVEMQILLPADSIESYCREFTALRRQHNRPIALTTVKCFKGRQRLLHFNGDGFNFTIELPNSPATLLFLADLDAINTAHGAISNVMKDSRLPRSVAEAQFPEFDLFKKRLQTFDPKRRFRSTISERLGL